MMTRTPSTARTCPVTPPVTPSTTPTRTPALRRGVGALCLAVLVAGAVAAPAAAQTTPTSSTSSTSSSTATTQTVEDFETGEVLPVSTPEEIAARQARARELAASITDQGAALAATRQQVDDLSRQHDEAVRARTDAETRLAQARAEQAIQQRRLAGAQALLTLRRTEIGRYAAQTYRSGTLETRGGSVETWMRVLEARSTDDLAQSVQMVEQVGRWRGSVVDTVEEAEAVQRDATARSAAAAEAADVAAAQATQAAAQATTLLDQQRLQVAVMTELLADLNDQATTLDSEISTAVRARAAAEQLRLQARTGGVGNAVTGPVGSCTGADVTGYPNGGIPVAALCPLWAAPGHVMRADAAYAFEQLSQAYAARFGDPLCVTDSYRSLAGQVALAATKPTLAATPGTSNHGWGTAVDLCGGVQTFGSPQHVWMRQNAPLLGFFHPVWAQANGSKPEAWHWEYGG